MSTTPTLVVPAAKDAPPASIPSVESKVAAAFKTEPPPPMPKAPMPPNVATLPKPPEVKIEPPKAEPPKVVPTLLPKKMTLVPVVEPDPFEKFALPETAPEEQRSQFTELKRISRDQHKKIKEFEAKMNAPAVTTVELDRLRAEHKAATDRLAIIDLQSHPDFIRQYSEPKSKALAEVSEILTYSGKEGVDLQWLLSADRKTFSTRVTDLTKDLSPMDATSVQTALRTAYALSVDEKSAMSKAGELSTQLHRKSEAQARQAFDEVSSNLGPLGEFLVTLDVPEGATVEEKSEISDYNQAVSGIRQNVERIVFGPTNEKSMAALGWKGATLDFLLSKGIPRMEKNYSALVESHNALAAELAAVKGAKGSGPISGDPAKGGTTTKTTDQMVAEAFGKK